MAPIYHNGQGPPQRADTCSRIIISPRELRSPLRTNLQVVHCPRCECAQRKDEEKKEEDEDTEELKRFTMQGNGKGICFI